MGERLLAFDVGNTRVKWALFEDGEPVAHGAIDEAGAQPRLPAGRPPDRIGLAPAGADRFEEQVRSFCAQHLPAVPLLAVATDGEFAGLVNSYDEPATMGVDRWLALLAARRAGPGACCVVDLGTALTVDVVGPDGRHRGGWIVPGEALMHRVLARGTARVGAHVARPGAPGLAWGRSTADCVAHGCSAALLATARAGVDRFLADWPTGRVFLTGGGAGWLREPVRERARSVTIDPLLVLRGLALRLEHGCG